MGSDKLNERMRSAPSGSGKLCTFLYGQPPVPQNSENAHCLDFYLPFRHSVPESAEPFLVRTPARGRLTTQHYPPSDKIKNRRPGKSGPIILPLSLNLIMQVSPNLPKTVRVSGTVTTLKNGQVAYPTVQPK
jgi:hypothetical protein